MRKLITAAMLLTMQGCATYVGIAASDGNGAPEVNLESPIGIIGGSYDVGAFRFFVEHHSGILYFEDGLGYNIGGVKYYFTGNTNTPWGARK
jgi:hypothetical protein